MGRHHLVLVLLGVAACSRKDSPAAEGPNTAPGPSSEQTVPPTALVYRKEVTVGGRTDHHLYAYDLVARTERLLSDLDAANGQQGHFDACAISADRSSVAFFSSDFRVPPEERPGARGAVWSVSADGKTFRQLASALTLRGTVQNREGGNETYQPDYYLKYPAWAADGRSLHFGLMLVFVRGTTTSATHLLGSTDGPLQGTACEWTTPAAIHPVDGALLAHRRECRGVPAGLWVYDGKPVAPQRMLIPERPPADQPGEQWSLATGHAQAWLRDGTGMLLIVNPAKGVRSRLVRWSAAANDFKTVYTPSNPGELLTAVRVGPRGDVLLTLSEEPEKDRPVHSLAVLDLAAGQATPLWPDRPKPAFLGVCF
jgi:hypothetical protein